MIRIYGDCRFEIVMTGLPGSDGVIEYWQNPV